MAETSERLLFVETSTVLPVLGFSNGPHNRYAQELLKDAGIATSIYVRMEAIRAWVCDTIAFAELASQCSSIADAKNFFSQGFGREPKTAVLLWQWIDRSSSEVRLSDDQAKEFVLELCNQALNLIHAFDLKLISKTNNSCGCQIGGKVLEPDHRQLLRDLSAFRKEFLTNVDDCKINKYLGIGKQRSRLKSLADCPSVASAPKIVEPINELLNKDHITCTHCRTIGDQVISLEHTASRTLIHTDKSFNKLCQCSGHPHEHIRSAASFKPKPTVTG